MRDESTSGAGADSGGAAPGEVRGRTPDSRVSSRLRRLLERLRQFNATNIELQERTVLRNQPWREDWLHWSYDGHAWQLHGHLVPPAGGREPSTTSSGWCPGSRFTSSR